MPSRHVSLPNPQPSLPRRFFSLQVSEGGGGGEARDDAMDGGATRREQQAKELDDSRPRKSSGGLADGIIPHILNLYGLRATAKDFEIYAPDATFEDPLMKALGVKQIKSAFYSLPKVFSVAEITEYSIQENAIAPGKAEILIDNKQHYKILGREVNLISLIKLNIEEGKVIRHEDWWNKKPLKNKDTINFPLVGQLVEVTKRGSMLVTHAMMGFGKDHSA